MGKPRSTTSKWEAFREFKTWRLWLYLLGTVPIAFGSLVATYFFLWSYQVAPTGWVCWTALAIGLIAVCVIARRFLSYVKEVRSRMAEGLPHRPSRFGLALLFLVVLEIGMVAPAKAIAIHSIVGPEYWSSALKTARQRYLFPWD